MERERETQNKQAKRDKETGRHEPVLDYANVEPNVEPNRQPPATMELENLAQHQSYRLPRPLGVYGGPLGCIGCSQNAWESTADDRVSEAAPDHTEAACGGTGAVLPV